MNLMVCGCCPLTVRVQIGARTYVNAGLGTYNPVDEVEEEACELWYRKCDMLEL